MNSNDKKTELFIHLLSSNHYRIYAFIQSLMVNNSDADDIMQETSAMMWQKFEEFQPGTDFVAWGVTIAKYRILEYRKKKKDCFFFSEETQQVLESQYKTMMPELDSRLMALKKCIEKLNERDHMILKMRYTFSYSAKAIASRIGTSIHMVYRHTSRIKSILIGCIHRELRAEEFNETIS